MLNIRSDWLNMGKSDSHRVIVRINEMLYNRFRNGKF